METRKQTLDKLYTDNISDDDLKDALGILTDDEKEEIVKKLEQKIC
tara:strand:- start:489 stop:626 length:138 start_codon:yes stop_codon:yes gene_type:complete